MVRRDSCNRLRTARRQRGRLLHVPVSDCGAELRLHSAYDRFHYTLTRMRAAFVAPQSARKLSVGPRIPVCP